MMADGKVRIGMVGLSSRGQSYIETCRLAANCQITAFCDKFEPLLGKGMKKAKDTDIQCYTDYGKMLKQAPVDAVFLIVAPEDNAKLILQALEAGKHVMCEVPLTYMLDDCWKIVTAVEKSGLKFQLAEQTRYHGWVRACRKMIREGKLGKILFVEGEYFHRYEHYWVDAETGEGISVEEAKKRKSLKSRMWNLKHNVWYSPHELSPLLHLLDDDRIEQVTGMSTRPHSYRNEWLPVADIEVSLMHTENDVVIRLAQSFILRNRSWGEHNYRVIGTEGRFEQDYNLKSGRILTADQYKDWVEYNWSKDPEIKDDEEEIANQSGHGGLDYYPVATFIRSILNDEQPPLDVYKAAEIVAPAILAGQSIEQGSVCLTVPEFRPNENRKAGQMPKF